MKSNSTDVYRLTNDACFVIVSVSANCECEREGKAIPMNFNVVERVLLPEYGGSKVTIDEQDYWMFRESDFLGKLDK